MFEGKGKKENSLLVIYFMGFDEERDEYWWFLGCFFKDIMV